jgi:polyisoprenoid-binding protein YceI
MSISRSLLLGAIAMPLLCASATTALAQEPPTQHAPEAGAVPSAGFTRDGVYIVDPTHTFVIYEISHYGTTTNRGRFSTSDGKITIESAGTTGTVDVTIDITSANTGVELLNKHLESKDFFNVADFPTGRFVASKIDFVDGKVNAVPGALTLLGTTEPVVLKAVRFNCYVSPVYKRQVCGGDFETTVTRSVFGVRWGLNAGFEDRVHLIVQVEAIAQQ